MRVELGKRRCVVTRESGDPRISGGPSGAAGESRLLYHVKLALNRQGFDFIKKRMWKDGHLVDDMKQYLRERNMKAARVLAIYNDRWLIEGADEIYNRTGSVVLTVEDLATSTVRTLEEDISDATKLEQTI